MGVYTIAGGKGGVGKSTTTASLGTALYDAGFDVALVDADLSMANLDGLFDVEVDRGINHVLAGRASVQDVLTEISAGLYLVPGDQCIDWYSEADPANLPSVIQSLADAVDIVLVDTGAGLGHETLVAMGLATGVIVATTPAEEAVVDVARTVEFGAHADATMLGAVVVRTSEDTDLGWIANRLGVPVLGSIPEATVGTEPVTTGDAGAAYRRLAATLVADQPEDDAPIHASASVDWTPDEPFDDARPTTSTSCALSTRFLSKLPDDVHLPV